MCVQVLPNTRNTSINETRKLLSNYSHTDKMMLRPSRYIFDDLVASCVYRVAVRTRNRFGFSDWTPEFYFKTAPGIMPEPVFQ